MGRLQRVIAVLRSRFTPTSGIINKTRLPRPTAHYIVIMFYSRTGARRRRRRRRRSRPLRNSAPTPSDARRTVPPRRINYQSLLLAKRGRYYCCRPFRRRARANVTRPPTTLFNSFCIRVRAGRLIRARDRRTTTSRDPHRNTKHFLYYYDQGS